MGLEAGPEGDDSSLVNRLMINDSKMWKGRHTHTWIYWRGEESSKTDDERSWTDASP